MGRLSPALYQLILPARHAENATNFGATKYRHPPKIRQTIAAYLLTGVQSKKVKTKSDHRHCPISVYTLMTSKKEAIIEIHR
jgi:hypothetical protein